MSTFEIGIIGGNGAMGRLFASFFRDNGYTVHIADIGTGMSRAELAARCTVIIISVPIGVTTEVIREVGPLMKPDHLLMDLTSLKVEPMRAMLQFSSAEVIGIHPLFGPDTLAVTGQNIVICPGRGGRWLPWLRELLEKNGARITETTPERHDRMMSLTQVLTHLNTIMMGLCLNDAGVAPSELNLYATPAFRMKLAMMEKVFDQNPRMYAEIITGNPATADVLRCYEERFRNLKELILEKDLDGLTALLEK
ncbi:MAG: prephenate dehydrogenase/arogenate dehydrogenase family protein [Syntrophales bacterium]|nr:prephenate dehydrogenase/arogenate dehydrogenase family protein [Syntrophales bacterium]